MAEIKGTLERRKGSKWWYGCYRSDGKRIAVNLRVEVRGTPPGPDQEHGSVHFEKSRSEAEAAMQGAVKQKNLHKPSTKPAQAAE